MEEKLQGHHKNVNVTFPKFYHIRVLKASPRECYAMGFDKIEINQRIV